MTNTNTVERLRELRAKATEGPWVENTHDVWTVRADGEPGIPLLREEIGNYRSWGRATTHEERESNAALIVEAINALPALLDAVEAGEDALKRARPYRDGSGVIEIPMHVWAAFAGALATLKGEG